jgi:NCS1 family nucleobase:cation symporter-1
MQYADVIRDSPPSNGDLAPTTPERRPDFARYAKDQRSQVVGQSIAMPLTMTGVSSIGIAVTAATIEEFGEAIWDPVALVARLLDDIPVLLVLATVTYVALSAAARTEPSIAAVTE